MNSGNIFNETFEQTHRALFGKDTKCLLGLIGEGTGIAAKVLKSMGINLKDARVEVEKIIGRGSGFVAVEIPFTSRAKRVLELSLEEARQLGKCCFTPCLFFCIYNYLVTTIFILPRIFFL